MRAIHEMRDYEGPLAGHSVEKLRDTRLEIECSSNLVVNTLSRVAATTIRSSQGDLNRSHNLAGHFVGQNNVFIPVVFGPPVLKRIHALSRHTNLDRTYLNGKTPSGSQTIDFPLPHGISRKANFFRGTPRPRANGYVSRIEIGKPLMTVNQ